MVNPGKYFSSLLLLMFLITTSYAQQLQADSTKNTSNYTYKSITGKSFILPGSLILTGSLLFDSKFNKDVQKRVTPNDLTRKNHILKLPNDTDSDDFVVQNPVQIADESLSWNQVTGMIAGRHHH